MLLSHSHRFVFVHVYKTGGSSVVGALRAYCEPRQGPLSEHHVTAAEIRNRVGDTSRTTTLNANPQAWQEYFTFAFVRNPWDFCVSLYHWLLQNPIHDMADFVRSLDGFAEFVRFLHRPERCPLNFKDGSFTTYRRPLNTFVTDDHGRVIVDFVGRFERINEDFAVVCRRIGVTEQLPHNNRANHPDYRECYDDGSKDLVADIYRDDIELFGYEF